MSYRIHSHKIQTLHIFFCKMKAIFSSINNHEIKLCVFLLFYSFFVTSKKKKKEKKYFPLSKSFVKSNFLLCFCSKKALTVWKFYDFSFTQILREIKFEDSWSATFANLTHLEIQNVEFFLFLHFLEPENCKMNIHFQP